jgi:hypothetical protein
MTDSGMEAPVDDAIEQHLSAAGSDEDAEREDDQGNTSWPEQIPLDADEADKADQERTVELDEDDYR